MRSLTFLSSVKPQILLALATLLLSQPAHAEWRAASSLSTTVPDAVAAEMEGQLYVMSGTVGTGVRRFFERYDLINDGWRPLTPLPTSLSDFSLAAGGGRVFVSGGHDSETLQASQKLWMYAPESGVWFELADMPFARSGHASFVVGNSVYIMGGRGEQAAYVQRYNLDTGAWQQTTSQMPLPVTNAALARFGSDFVLAGGTTIDGRDTATVQAFSPASDSWRVLVSIPAASSAGALGEVDGRLHYAGGYSQTEGKVLNSHHQLSDGVWRRLKNLPQARHQMAYFGTGKELFIIGGALGSGFYSLFTASDRVSVFRP
jgi:N-acetylneuraminic acid mutarotase